MLSRFQNTAQGYPAAVPEADGVPVQLDLVGPAPQCRGVS